MSFSLVRAVARSARNVNATRAFSVSVAARKDFVQELYVKELKAYKAPIAAKDAHVGNVKELVLPKAPEAPKLPSDLTSEISAYESSIPDLAEVTPVAATGSADASNSADGFLAFLEQDLPKDEAHH
ncbi:hypothetical protein DL93DRAFT_2076548 [Clavulina sp. PMI_390]|nr:hypothetical protein DL93DRAFT_2076548 [Clavulina sp. PMI_390]